MTPPLVRLVTQADLIAPWRKDAACKGAPPDLFFPQRGNRDSTSAAALAYCERCPVTAECLAAGRGEIGVWGGKSAKARGVRNGAPRKIPTIQHGTEAGYQAHRRHGTDTCRDCRDAHNSYKDLR